MPYVIRTPQETPRPDTDDFLEQYLHSVAMTFDDEYARESAQDAIDFIRDHPDYPWVAPGEHMKPRRAISRAVVRLALEKGYDRLDLLDDLEVASLREEIGERLSSLVDSERVDDMPQWVLDRYRNKNPLKVSDAKTMLAGAQSKTERYK